MPDHLREMSSGLRRGEGEADPGRLGGWTGSHSDGERLLARGILLWLSSFSPDVCCSLPGFRISSPAHSTPIYDYWVGGRDLPFHPELSNENAVLVGLTFGLLGLVCGVCCRLLAV